LTPPTWSPDGTVLLAIDEHGWFTVRPDGTERTVIAPALSPDIGPEPGEPRFSFFGIYIRPSWQPLPER
jgi:hypothetical protein